MVGVIGVLLSKEIRVETRKDKMALLLYFVWTLSSELITLFVRSPYL